MATVLYSGVAADKFKVKGACTDLMKFHKNEIKLQ
jgi:hypothetical protein